MPPSKHSRHLILAPCSRRKRGKPAARVAAADLPRGKLRDVAAEWVRRVSLASADVPAGDYYCGRGPAEARAAACESGAHLVFVSAGLGYVPAATLVPRYSLTVAERDPDSIGRIVEGDAPPQIWWSTLKQAKAKTGLGSTSLLELAGDSGALIVAALPGAYLGMIGQDLVQLSPGVRARVRIVGAPRSAVPPTLADLWMPYDARFDGTLGDFAQRAARHFLAEVASRAPTAGAAEHAATVRGLLAPLPEAERRARRRAGSDTELIGAIGELLPKAHGRSGVTLRLLRREAGWACEQGRFRRLFAAALAGEGGA
jgi:hypothetical protein